MNNVGGYTLEHWQKGESWSGSSLLWSHLESLLCLTWLLSIGRIEDVPSRKLRWLLYASVNGLCIDDLPIYQALWFSIAVFNCQRVGASKPTHSSLVPSRCLQRFVVLFLDASQIQAAQRHLIRNRILPDIPHVHCLTSPAPPIFEYVSYLYLPLIVDWSPGYLTKNCGVVWIPQGDFAIWGVPGS